MGIGAHSRRLAGGCVIALLLALAALPGSALAGARMASAPARVQNQAEILRLLRQEHFVSPRAPAAPSSAAGRSSRRRSRIAQRFPRLSSSPPAWWPRMPGGLAFPAYDGPQRPFPIGSEGYVPASGYMASVGRLYGLRPDGRSWDICTAAVVAPDMILTAAHCVFDLQSGQQNQGWAFIPKMMGHSRPLHVWVGYRGTYWRGFPAHPTTAIDYAFIKLRRRSGRDIGSLTGVNEILEYASPKQLVMEGYPASGPFARRCSGSSCYLWYCSSPLGGTYKDAYGLELGMGCKDGEGSSGAPWLVRDGRRLEVASVVSTGKFFGHQNYARNIWGPQFTRDTGRLLRAAERGR